jgi:LSU ribosomal protein L10P
MRKSWQVKAELISSYKDRLQRAQLVIFFNYSGIDAYPLTKLRAELKAMDGELVVGKNTLFYRGFYGIPRWRP